MTILLLLLACLAVCGQANKKVVCYFDSLSFQRNGDGFFSVEKNGNAHLCTHIIYAYAKLKGNFLHHRRWWENGTSFYRGLYEDVVNLKRKNNRLKVLLGVGGHDLGNKPFSVLALCASNREEFYGYTFFYLRQYGFDGLSIDWIHPASNGGPPWDKKSLLLLMKGVFASFVKYARTTGRKRLLLTGLLSADKGIIERAYDLPELAKYMDFVLLSTYDFNDGDWSRTQAISPLYPDDSTAENDPHNVDWAVNHYLSSRMPRDKIVIGIPLFGRFFTLADRNKRGIGARAFYGLHTGRYTHKRGFLAYYEVCSKHLKYHTFIRQRSIKVMSEGLEWISYEDRNTVTQKACYVKQKDLGGVMLFSLDLDDFAGVFCSQGKYPLINAVVNELKSTSRMNCIVRSLSTRSDEAVEPDPSLGKGENASSLNFCTKTGTALEPHPTDCTKFYRCEHGRGTQVACPEDFVFVPVNRTCAFRGN